MRNAVFGSPTDRHTMSNRIPEEGGVSAPEGYYAVSFVALMGGAPTTASPRIVHEPRPRPFPA